MALPYEPLGYAVNPKSGVVHKRHAEHAVGLRRTSAAGVANMLSQPKLCEACFGAPPKPAKRTSTRFNPKPVKVIEPEPEPIPSAGELYAATLAAEGEEVPDGED